MLDTDCPDGACHEKVKQVHAAVFEKNGIRDCVKNKLSRKFFWSVVSGFILFLLAVFTTGYTIYARADDKKDERLKKLENAQIEFSINSAIINERLSNMQRDLNKKIEEDKETNKAILKKLEELKNNE